MSSKPLTIYPMKILAPDEFIETNDEVDCSIDVESTLVQSGVEFIQGVQMTLTYEHYQDDPAYANSVTITPSVVDLGDFGPDQMKTATFSLKLVDAQKGVDVNRLYVRLTGTIPLDLTERQAFDVRQDQKQHPLLDFLSQPIIWSPVTRSIEAKER